MSSEFGKENGSKEKDLQVPCTHPREKEAQLLGLGGKKAERAGLNPKSKRSVMELIGAKCKGGFLLTIPSSGQIQRLEWAISRTS